jgi:prepilin-type N-terminal cleavage/methylation domain-containing protein
MARTALIGGARTCAATASRYGKLRRAFTLVELLVVIAIIGALNAL